MTRIKKLKMVPVTDTRCKDCDLLKDPSTILPYKAPWEKEILAVCTGHGEYHYKGELVQEDFAIACNEFTAQVTAT